MPVSTLDHVLSGRMTDKQLFIKMDVEGAEYQVLKGALATICREVKPVWLLEVCFQEFHPDGANPDFENIFTLFFNNGYRAYTATEPPKPVTPEEVAHWIKSNSIDSGTFNYVFIDAQNTALEI